MGQEFSDYFDKGISALLSRLPTFDADGLAYYDTIRKILAKPYYQKLQVKLLRFLSKVTNQNRLADYAEKWDRGFRTKWGLGAWTSYVQKTFENGIRIEGPRFPINFLSYSLGDSGLSIIPRLTASPAPGLLE